MKDGSRKLVHFSACSASGRSTFSGLVQLNHTYENNRFVLNHRAGDGRVSELVCAEEGGANGRLYCVDDHSRHVHDQEDHCEDVEHQEDEWRFSGSVGFTGSQEEHEESGSFAFSKRIGFTFADSLI
jgi:hypothetical protein